MHSFNKYPIAKRQHVNHTVLAINSFGKKSELTMSNIPVKMYFKICAVNIIKGIYVISTTMTRLTHSIQSGIS